jgi:hypothetical protein
MMTTKGLSVEKMRDEITRMSEDLGCDFKLDPDRALSSYRRGAPLKLRELRTLPEGAVVWVWYKEHGERGPRINQAMRISKDSACDSWGLEDGSSFAAEFTPTGDYDPDKGQYALPGDDTECFDEGGGEGEMYLYHATPKTPAKKAPRKR